MNCTCHPDDRPAGECPQKFAASDCKDAAYHASVVHGLRSSGWSKIDAEQEADNRIAERKARHG